MTGQQGVSRPLKNTLFISIPWNNQRANDREKGDECKEDKKLA